LRKYAGALRWDQPCPSALNWRPTQIAMSARARRGGHPQQDRISLSFTGTLSTCSASLSYGDARALSKQRAGTQAYGHCHGGVGATAQNGDGLF
jgi:hypothetical protein